MQPSRDVIVGLRSLVINLVCAGVVGLAYRLIYSGQSSGQYIALFIFGVCSAFAAPSFFKRSPLLGIAFAAASSVMLGLLWVFRGIWWPFSGT